MNPMNIRRDRVKLKKEQSPKKRIIQNQKKELPNWLINLMIYGAYFITVIIVVIIMWFPVRWLHYKFGYEYKVQKAIIEMVKPEALKEKYRKGI